MSWQFAAHSRCCGDASKRSGWRLTDHRVLRGGSFNNNRRNARCAHRNRNNPDNRNNNIGFRVVVSTLFNGTCRKCGAGLFPAFTAEAKNGRTRSWPRLLRRPGE